MADDDETPDVEVNVNPEPDEEPEEPETDDVVVAPTIVTTSSDDGIVEQLVAARVENAELRARLDALEAAQVETAIVAADAQATADAAVDVSRETLDVIEAEAEGEQADPEEDTEPRREHAWYRPLGRRD